MMTPSSAPLVGGLQKINDSPGENLALFGHVTVASLMSSPPWRCWRSPLLLEATLALSLVSQVLFALFGFYHQVQPGLLLCLCPIHLVVIAMHID
jgi:hypothetical protein